MVPEKKIETSPLDGCWWGKGLQANNWKYLVMNKEKIKMTIFLNLQSEVTIQSKMPFIVHVRSFMDIIFLDQQNQWDTEILNRLAPFPHST